MTDNGGKPSDARRSDRDVDASQAGRESMLARHKLIEAMIDNNLRQLKFDSARGGADIERACALRDISRGGDDSEPTERLAEVESRIERLEEEHRVSSPSANGSNSPCSNSTRERHKTKVSHMNAASRGVQDVGQLSEEDRSKDEFFVSWRMSPKR